MRKDLELLKRTRKPLQGCEISNLDHCAISKVLGSDRLAGSYRELSRSKVQANGVAPFDLSTALHPDPAGK